MSASAVDVRSYGGANALEELKADRQQDMDFAVELARQNGMLPSITSASA